METFQAFLHPFNSPTASTAPAPLHIDYDADLPRDRKPLARSISQCRRAMAAIREDLVRWGEQDRPSPGSAAGEGVAGEIGITGLAGEMRRGVEMVALTPTKQRMRSTVGREVRSSRQPESGAEAC